MENHEMRAFVMY